MSEEHLAGYHYLPPEWARHEATWLAWPGPLDWPGRYQGVLWAFADMVRHLSAGETVRLAVGSARLEASARRHLAAVGADTSRVEFLPLPTDRSWMRDNGPCVLLAPDGTRVVADFVFTGWAKYKNHLLDDRVPRQAADHLALPLLPTAAGGARVVLEGGAIEVDGQGTLLTTEECLLHPKVQVRNPGFTRADYEALFKHLFGATRVFWLGDGIAGDDTHGHVDDLCRFVNPGTVVLVQEGNPHDANYRALAENRERLQDLRLAGGEKPEIVHLPMPGPQVYKGLRLPASYANFYLANACVLVPTFNDPNDVKALGILSELCDRPVVGIHASDLVLGRGTVHCLSRQEPAA